MKHKNTEAWKYYKIEGDKIVRNKKICPKCGSFLADHKDRLYCGKCHFTQFKK